MPSIYLSCPHTLTAGEAADLEVKDAGHVMAMHLKYGTALVSPAPRKEGDLCEAELEVKLGYEKPDWTVGLHGGWYVEEGPPETCPDCGHTYTKEEYEALEAQADKAAAEYWDDGGYDGE